MIVHHHRFRKSLCTALLFALTLSTTARAGEWTWQHPTPQGNTLSRVRFSGEGAGYAVGEFGTIMVTYDGGLSWDLQYEGVTDNLQDVHVWNAVTATIVGDNGMILGTTDGGTVWAERPSPTAYGLNGVFFADSLNGWAAGDHKTMCHTTDGGATWSLQTLASVMGNPGANDVWFVSVSEGWAVGGTASSGVIWHTNNGGGQWTIHSMVAVSLLAISFNPSGAGLAVGEGGTMYRSTDAGATWLPATSGTTRGLNDILWSGSEEVFVSGDNGMLLHSTNAGASWTGEQLGTTASLNGISTDGLTTVLVGEYGAIARRSGTGAWSFVNTGDHLCVNWLTMTDASSGFAVGQSGLILRTTDGGSTWVEQANGVSGSSFYGADVAGFDNAWVAGDLGVLLCTTNGGATWVEQPTQTTRTLFSVSAVSTTVAWVAGDAGTLLKTTNGGATWTSLPTGYGDIFFGVKFVDGGNGWIVGDNGRILHTTTGGASWVPQSGGTTAALFYADFIDAQTGWCAGAGGTILRTTDGGATWSPGMTGTATTLYLVTGSPASLWAVGDSGLVIHSTDAGATWTSEFAKTGFDLFGLAAVSDSVAWISGDYGTILKTGTPSVRVDVTVPLTSGWNLLANPVERIPGTSGVLALYPSSSYAYGFGFDPATGYVQHTTLDAGRGYWLKFSTPGSALIPGTRLLSATIDVVPGWNLVGSISAPVDTGMISTSPPGLRTSAWYGYGGGYLPVASLVPGLGYWVKMGGSGQLVIGAPEVPARALSAEPRPSGRRPEVRPHSGGKRLQGSGR
jgi:photosystem II stability/assembly factor-like uncharacterized protein